MAGDIKSLNSLIMFHTHNFEEIERFYAEPILKFNAWYMSARDGRRMAFGQTTILYKCVDREMELSDGTFVRDGELMGNGRRGCGKTTTQEILGKPKAD